MKTFTRTMLLLIAAVLTPGSAVTAESAAKTEGDSNKKAVLVTSASTGIGRKITEVLAARGVYVCAGARKEKDLKELDAIENVQSIRLAVTIQEDFDAALRGGDSSTEDR